MKQNLCIFFFHYRQSQVYVDPVVRSKIIDPYNYSLVTLYGRILKGLFEHERLKPANIRMSQGNVQNLAQLRQIMNKGFKLN